MRIAVYYNGEHITTVEHSTAIRLASKGRIALTEKGRLELAILKVGESVEEGNHKLTAVA